MLQAEVFAHTARPQVKGRLTVSLAASAMAVAPSSVASFMIVPPMASFI